MTDASGLTTANSALKAIKVDYAAPSSPTQILVAPKAGGDGNEAWIAITAGQANGGSAKLKMNGQVIATDNEINANDACLNFNLSTELTTTWLNAVKAGTAAVEITDAVGNVTNAYLDSLPLSQMNTPFTGDKTAPSAVAATRTGWGFYVGDQATLKFSEATDKAANLNNIRFSDSDGHTLSLGAASAAWNSAGTELTITVGTGSTASFGDLIVSLSGVKDLAGNAADVVFQYPQ